MLKLRIKSFRRVVTTSLVVGVVGVVAVMAASPVLATNLRYRPVSPTFGGNPSSAEWAKFNAHVQKRDPGANTGQGSTAIPDFSGLFDSLNQLEGDFSDTTIIIPIF